MRVRLLKRHFLKAAQLTAVQLNCALRALQHDDPHPDAQVLVHAFAVEVVGYSRLLQLKKVGV